MLGFSEITGTDAVTGLQTTVNGLSGTETNVSNGTVGTVSHPAGYVMMVDPGHDFTDVLCQLGGAGAQYASGGQYPAVDNSRFVASYAGVCSNANQQRDVTEILQCYSPEQLPVLNALAQEFAVCDSWHASMPGPTWPTTNPEFFSRNQFFPGTRSQSESPIVVFEGHLSYDFKPRLWVSLDGNFWYGGETSLGGVPNPKTTERNSRIGATASIPISKHQSLKFSYNNGAYIYYGGNFQNVSVAWQYSWIGWPK